MLENNPITGTNLDKLIGYKELYGVKGLRLWSQEKELISLLAHIAEKDFTFYDAGTNEGFYPVYIQYLTSGRCNVKMFEPYKELHQRVKKMMDRYRKETMTFYPYGLWSENTNIPFYARTTAPRNGKPSLKASSFVKHPKENSNHAENLQVITLDSIVGHDQIDFLKIDVEGGEEHVLSGAKNSLRTHRIKTIFVEVHNVYLGGNFKSIVDMLRGFGYKVVNKQGKEHFNYNHSKAHLYATTLPSVIQKLKDFDLHQYYVTLNG